MSILIADSDSLRKIESNKYNIMDMRGLSIFSSRHMMVVSQVIPSIYGDFGLVSTSFKFLGPDSYFWKFLFLAVIVISSSD
jgi:hypothetical protein